MKKFVVLAAAIYMALGYGFALEQTTPEDIINTMSENIDMTLMEFLAGLESQAQQIVEDNTALYLSEYCVANDILASIDIVDCGKYQGVTHVLDDILDVIVPDMGAMIDVSSDDVGSIDEAQIIIEETQWQVKQEIAKFDALGQMMQKALSKPNLTDKQEFGIKYILFAIACVKDLFGLLPDFLDSMMSYIVDLRDAFGDVSID